MKRAPAGALSFFSALRFYAPGVKFAALADESRPPRFCGGAGGGENFFAAHGTIELRKRQLMDEEGNRAPAERPRCRPAKTLSRPADEVAGPSVVPTLRFAEHASGGMDAARLRAALSGPSRGDGAGECVGRGRGTCGRLRLGREKATGRLCVLAMRCVASARTEKRRQSVQGAALWPRRLRADRGKTTRTALIRLLSVVSVPEKKPPHAEGTPRFLSVASALSEKSSVRFPEILLRMFPPSGQR